MQGADRALVVDVQNERIRLQNLTRLQEQQEAAQPPHNLSMSSAETESPAPGAASKLTVRAMPDPDASFNTDRLESLQSAEHIRLSMQRYLADKHEHLKKTSQQLADKTDKAAAAPSSFARPGGSSAVSSSRPTSFVRSLEDLRCVRC